MPDAETIENQQQLLDTLRRRAVHLQQQQARLGMLTPFSIADDLRESQQQISQIKTTLREWGVDTPDLPEDTASAIDQVSSLPKQARVGLEALAELIRTQAAQSAVAVYQANFESTCRHIALLGGYKQLHDLFQQLEDRYTILARCCKNLQFDPNAWYDLEENEPELYDKATELLDCAAGTLFTAESAAWTPRVARAQQDLRMALEAQDAERLRDALRRIKEILARQPSRINTRMAGVAGMLQLATLVATLQQISQQFDIATDADQHRFGEFRRGVAALGDLDRRLTQAVRLHSIFQEFDDELRRIEGTLEQSLSELIDAWPDLEPMVQSLCSADVEWATRLRALGADVEQALTSRDPLKLRRTFGRYRSCATVSFNRVDYDLRDLCAELQQIGAPLDHLLKMIA